MEIRSFGSDAAPALAAGAGSRTIEGYAVVFGQESEVLYDPARRRRFVEVIEPGAITPALLESSDVKALLEHDRGRLLARCSAGRGTLSLSVDGHGVRYRFEAPATAEGNYAVEMVRRGDLAGSSFAYVADECEDVRWEKRADGVPLRRVTRIRWIGDVSIVSDPAYTGTEVSVRHMDSLFPPREDGWKDEAARLRRLAEDEE